MRGSTWVVMVMWLTGSWCSAAAQRSEKPVNLEALYQQVDEAISRSPGYVAEREREIASLKRDLQAAGDAERRLLISGQLFALYKPYKNDSALYYAQQTIDQADSLGRPDVAGHYRALMARQCSNAGMYVESVSILRQVDKSVLDRQGLTDYYDAYMHVCGEVAAYTLIPAVRDKNYAMQDHYRDSLMTVADKGSDQYLHLLMSNLVARQEYQDALKVSDQWLNMTTEGTHADAYAAYYRHIVYDKLGNQEMTRYWLAKSALDDIKCAVMDQASLITLAHLLNYDGDLERSYRYIRFTWKCNQFFNTRMRASQISPVLDVIEKNYQDANSRNMLLLTVFAVVFCLMTLCFIGVFLYMLSQRRQLTRAQQELKASNERYATANHRLQVMNDTVTKYNQQLFDINHQLQEKTKKETD